MAKGTKKKSTKSQMPKTVAGVKVPKEIRDFGGSIGAWFNTHLGREIMAEAIVAAAGAAAIALRKNAPSAEQVSKAGKQVSRAGKEVVDTGTEAASKTKDLVQAAVGVVSDVVASGVQKLLPDETPAPRRRGPGRPKSVPAEVAAEAAPQPRRRGPRAGRPAGTPGRPRKARAVSSEPSTEGDKE